MENRKLLILEKARSINDRIDCDVIQDCITQLEKATSLEQIIFIAQDLQGAIQYRGGRITEIEQLINELSSIHIQTLIAQ